MKLNIKKKLKSLTALALATAVRPGELDMDAAASIQLNGQ